MHSKLNELKKSNTKNAWMISLGLHLSLLLPFIIMAITHKLIQEKESEVLNFTVVEKIKIDKKAKAPLKPVLAKEAPVKEEVEVKEKRKVFGATKKSHKSDTGVAVKKGNITAKKMDDLELTDDDEESLPIPADEFLISSMPRLIEEFRPKYPESAKKAGIEGKVVFEILIDEKGSVRQITLIQSLDQVLDQEAQKALKKFRFVPANIDGKAVAVKIKYAINFELED